MTIEQREQWDRTRTRGRFHYVALHGILFFGSVFATIVLLARLTVLRSPVVKWGSLSEELLQFVLEAILFGLWAGFWTWHLNEKRFLSGAENPRRP